MSDFIPLWTALGVGIAQGEEEKNEKEKNEKTGTAGAKSSPGVEV